MGEQVRSQRDNSCHIATLHLARSRRSYENVDTGLGCQCCRMTHVNEVVPENATPAHRNCSRSSLVLPRQFPPVPGPTEYVQDESTHPTLRIGMRIASSRDVLIALSITGLVRTSRSFKAEVVTG